MTTNDFLDNDHPDSLGVRPMRRSEGIAYLMKDGDLSVPCSRYGRCTSDCAEVAWRLAYVWTREACEELTTDILDQMMGYVVNDHDTVSEIIRSYGHRMYR